MTDPGRPDPRRAVPRTDVVLADPRLRLAVDRIGAAQVMAAVRQAQQEARSGGLAPVDVPDRAVAILPTGASELRSVINATGVVLHTNLGRAPLSTAAIAALTAAAGYVDVEFDLDTGSRARRGRGTAAALREAVPAAGDVLVVNNGAAALLLAVTTLAGGGEILVSRGEMVEIGDGFRLPDLMAATGSRIIEVGTTNRTRLADYAAVIGPETRCIVKIHPSNFRITGFTAQSSIAELATLPVPLIADIGSGLLRPDLLLPDEPDAATALTAGADVVTCSGDKLLGGPQAGLLLGAATLIQAMRHHPLARALRPDKLTLAALEATLRGPATPTFAALHADPATLRLRCERLAELLGDDAGGEVVPCQGAVGGGGAPGVPLPGWAVALPADLAERLRTGETPVVGRVTGDRLLLDLRCVPEATDSALAEAVRFAVAAGR